MSIKVLFAGAVLTLFVSNVFAQSAAVKSACNGAMKEVDRCAVVTGESDDADEGKNFIKETMALEGIDKEIIKLCNKIKEELIKSNCGKNEEYEVEEPLGIF